MTMQTDLFNFAYIPAWFEQLYTLAQLATPEPWRYKTPNTKRKIRKLQFLSDISTRYSENRRWSIIAPLKRKQTQLFMYATNLPVSIQGCIHRHIKIFTCALSAIGSATR